MQSVRGKVQNMRRKNGRCEGKSKVRGEKCEECKKAKVQKEVRSEGESAQCEGKKY